MLAVAAFLVVAGASLPAAAQTRSLKLFNTHTGESATVVFKRNGQFDAAGLKQLSHMLRDWRRDEPTRMAPELFDLIYEVYAEVGASEPIHIVSGYRSPVTNNMLRSRSRGVAKLSQHMLGKAMDFFIPGVPLAKLRETGLRKQFGGVGFYPTSGSPFVHMDVGSVRHWPRMTRDQLARVFPNGKTVHLPADGPPLSRYQEALAEVERYKGRNAVPSSGDDDDDAPSGNRRGDDTAGGDGGLLAGLFGWGKKSDEAKPPAQVAARMQPQPQPRASAQPIDDDTPPGLAPQPPRQQVASLPAPAEPLPIPTARPTVPAQVTMQPAPGAILALPQARPADAATRPTAGANGADAGQPVGWMVGPQPVAPPAQAPEPMAMPAQPAYQVATGMPMPRPRPGLPPPLQAVAAVNSAAGDPGGPVEPSSALGYAAPGLPIPNARPAAPDEPAPAQTALPPPLAPLPSAVPVPAGRPQQVASLGSGATTLSPPPAPAKSGTPGREGRPATVARGGDALYRLINRVAAIPPARLLDGNATMRQKSFARLNHPDQEGLPQLIGKPKAAIAYGFGREINGGLRTDSFSGQAIGRLPVVKVE